MNVTGERMTSEILIGILTYTENVVMLIRGGEPEFRQSSDLKRPPFWVAAVVDTLVTFS